jgi:CRP/FNR family transcriptional regulator
MMLLGSMRAEERLATFLLNLSRRFMRRGFSASDFHLRMTREEIGSYLGLKLETVSRLFSAFQKDGLIDVQQKHVRIVSIAGLEAVLATTRH